MKRKPLVNFKGKYFWAILTIVMGVTEVMTAGKDIYDTRKLQKALTPKKLSDPVVKEIEKKEEEAQ